VPDTGHSWSPTGEQIVFSRPTPGSGMQVLRRELFVMNADGTGQTQLTDTPGINIDPNWGRLRVRVGQ
jgi:Tol biopolymer transport system component